MEAILLEFSAKLPTTSEATLAFAKLHGYKETVQEEKIIEIKETGLEGEEIIRQQSGFEKVVNTQSAYDFVKDITGNHIATFLNGLIVNEAKNELQRKQEEAQAEYQQSIQNGFATIKEYLVIEVK